LSVSQHGKTWLLRLGGEEKRKNSWEKGKKKKLVKVVNRRLAERRVTEGRWWEIDSKDNKQEQKTLRLK